MDQCAWSTQAWTFRSTLRFSASCRKTALPPFDVFWWHRNFVHHSLENNSKRAGLWSKMLSIFSLTLSNPFIDFEHYLVRFGIKKDEKSELNLFSINFPFGFRVYLGILTFHSFDEFNFWFVHRLCCHTWQRICEDVNFRLRAFSTMHCQQDQSSHKVVFSKDLRREVENSILARRSPVIQNATWFQNDWDVLIPHLVNTLGLCHPLRHCLGLLLKLSRRKVCEQTADITWFIKSSICHEVNDECHWSVVNIHFVLISASWSHVHVFWQNILIQISLFQTTNTNQLCVLVTCLTFGLRPSLTIWIAAALSSNMQGWVEELLGILVGTWSMDWNTQILRKWKLPECERDENDSFAFCDAQGFPWLMLLEKSSSTHSPNWRAGKPSIRTPASSDINFKAQHCCEKLRFASCTSTRWERTCVIQIRTKHLLTFDCCNLSILATFFTRFVPIAPEYLLTIINLVVQFLPITSIPGQLEHIPQRAPRFHNLLGGIWWYFMRRVATCWREDASFF